MYYIQINTVRKYILDDNKKILLVSYRNTDLERLDDVWLVVVQTDLERLDDVRLVPV